MSDEQANTYTEVTEEPGYFDRAVDAVGSIGEAAVHGARAGYHYAAEQYHIHAAAYAEAHDHRADVEPHLDAATSARLDHNIEMNAAREALGQEPVDYENEEPLINPDPLNYQAEE